VLNNRLLHGRNQRIRLTFYALEPVPEVPDVGIGDDRALTTVDKCIVGRFIAVLGAYRFRCPQALVQELGGARSNDRLKQAAA